VYSIQLLRTELSWVDPFDPINWIEFHPDLLSQLELQHQQQQQLRIFALGRRFSASASASASIRHQQHSLLHTQECVRVHTHTGECVWARTTHRRVCTRVCVCHICTPSLSLRPSNIWNFGRGSTSWLFSPTTLLGLGNFFFFGWRPQLRTWDFFSVTSATLATPTLGDLGGLSDLDLRWPSMIFDDPRGTSTTSDLWWPLMTSSASDDLDRAVSMIEKILT